MVDVLIASINKEHTRAGDSGAGSKQPEHDEAAAATRSREAGHERAGTRPDRAGRSQLRRGFATRPPFWPKARRSDGPASDQSAANTELADHAGARPYWLGLVGGPRRRDPASRKHAAGGTLGRLVHPEPGTGRDVL
jgi:hypothetical protein